MTQLSIDVYTGDRSELRSPFELAEDSAAELDSYLGSGRVLVARHGDEIGGHLQLVELNAPGEVELKNMAVREDLQGHGIGARLVAAAIELVRSDGRQLLLVATAAADLGNLRFYQRQGFRFRSIERDAFTTATGYDGIVIDGIELRDRVWFDQSL